MRVRISRGVKIRRIIKRMIPTSLLLLEVSVKIETLALIGGWIARVEYLSIRSPF